ILRFCERSAQPSAKAKRSDLGQNGGTRSAWNDRGPQLRCRLVEHNDGSVSNPGEMAQMLLQLRKAHAGAFDLDDGVIATAEVESAIGSDIHAVRAHMFTPRHMRRAHAQKPVPASFARYARQGAPGCAGAITASPSDSACFSAAEDFGDRDAEDRRGHLSGPLG